MKCTVCLLLLLFSVFYSRSQSISGQLSTSTNSISFSLKTNFSKIKIDYNQGEKNYFSSQGKYGEPEIPIVQKKYVLPLNADNISISVTSYSEYQLSGDFLLYPEQPPIPLDYGEPPEWIEPNEIIYNSDVDYPGKKVEISTVESAIGYKIVTVNLYPISYKPLSQKIKCYTDISFNVSYSINNSNLVIPERISSFRNNNNISHTKSIVSNPKDVSSFLGGALQVVDNNIVTNLQIPIFPISTGIVPDEIIITSPELESSFTALENWHNKCGLPTAIITTSEISQQYPASDLAESIFYYLKDVYNKYGSTYIILGGDVGIIPARYAYYDSHLHVWRPTDLYYSDVYKINFPNYNWNGNGNSQYGETGTNGDLLDLGSDHYVGRFPINTINEANTLVAKIIGYEHSSQTNQNYFNNLLFMTGYLSPGYADYMGDDINDQIINPLLASNTQLIAWKLYDDPSLGNVITPFDEILNRTTAINNLNTGGASFGSPFHLVYHMDHSSAYNMGTSSKVAHQSLSRDDVLNLSNNPDFQIFFTGGCSPNSFDFNEGISENYMLSQGGGVAFIGSTATSYSSDYIYFKTFCNILYNFGNYRIGTTLKAAATYPDYRNRIALLGDPMMEIWTNTPSILTTTNPTSIYTGQQTINVTLYGLNLNDAALICLYKDGEIYVRQNVIGTGSPVAINLDCTPDTPGDLYLTMTSHNYRPLEKTINVISNPGTHLFVSSSTVDDDDVLPSSGNSDGNIDAGETIQLNSSITNQGLTNAPNVTANISTTSTYLAVSQSTSAFGQINSLTTVPGNQSYIINISPNSPDHSLAAVTASIQSTLNYTDYLNFEIHAPIPQVNLTHISTSINNDNIIDPGDQVHLTFEIYNSGSGKATNITGTISNTSIYISNVSVPTAFFSTISPYMDQSNPIPFEFDVVQSYNSQTILLSLTLISSLGQQWAYNINLDAPQSISGLDYTSDNNSISTFWNCVPNAKGYNIYRSDSPNGNYNKLNSKIIQGFSGYTDLGLNELTIYYYKVSVVSTSGVEGPLSSELKAWTTLPYHVNWPEKTIIPDVIGGRSEGSAVVSDIDIDNNKEVFLTLSDGVNCETGTLMGFYHDREEIFDIDNNPTTVSGFHAYAKSGIQCTPAVGDINNDNIEEIITVTRGDNSDFDRQEIFVNSVIDGNNDNKPDLLWSKAIGGPNTRGVVLSDIDNNGSLEIIEKGCWGSPINVINGNGTNYPGSWPLSIGCQTGSGMPVACDIDNDGFNEIILGYQTATYENSHTDAGIYIYNSDGSPYITNNQDGLFYKYANNSVYDQMDCVPVFADINGDGYTEMIFVSGRLSSLKARVFIMDRLGNFITGWGYDSHLIDITAVGENHNVLWLPSPCVGDVDDDNQLEICIAEAGKIYCWKADGSAFNQNFPIDCPNLEQKLFSPLLADVDGDNFVDIIVASNSLTGGIYAYHIDGSLITGWPLRIKSSTSPVIDDIDNDGKVEIIASEGNIIYVWDANGNANKIEWGTYRHDNHNSGIYEYSGCDYYPNNPIIINSNVTWSTNKIMNSDIIIEQNNTLTISSTISMPEHSKICVKQGAKLIINGGKLTTSCDNLWEGIEVWGDNNYSQFVENGVQHQGYLELLNNATIENAHYAVSVGDPLVWNTFGGIVKAYNSNFLNNWKSVGFMSYHNYYPGTSDPAPNQSKFENCTFEITDNFIRGDFQAQITMWDVNGIYISGCDFADNRTTVTDINRMGDGIYTLDANFTVRAICNNPNPPIPCPVQDLHRSSFFGFNNGIYATGSWKDQSVTVSQTDFRKNQTAIKLESANNARILQCAIRIGESNATNISECYGLFAKFSTGYQVEENEFIGIPSSFLTWGAFFEYNGANYNETYKNRFTDLNFGEVGYALNRDRTNPYIGLQFLCNFNDNESVHGNDFVSYRNINLPDFNDHGIRDFQGDYTMSAGNIFTHDPLANVGDFANQTLNPLYYHYYNDPPIYYTNGLVFPVYLNINNLCPSRINSHDPIEKLTDSEKSGIQNEIDNFKTIYANLKYVHSQLIDGGNSGALVNQIQLSWPEDIWELHDELMSKSPYLSEEVMRTAALKNTLPQAMILEICLSNPDISKNLKFQEFLAEDIPNPLPAYMIDLIKAAASGTTIRTALEGSLAEYHSKYSYRANKLIINQKSDTSNINVSNLISLLQNHKSLQSFYEVIDILISKGEWSKANDSIIILPSRFLLSETQVVELNHFTNWYQFRISVYQANKSLMQLDSTEISTLVEMGSDYQDWVGARIKNLLCFGYNICFDEFPQIELQKDQHSIPSNSETGKNKVKVYPNPGNTYIVFEIIAPNSDENSVMAVTDISGKLLDKVNMLKDKFVYLLDIREYDNGTYYYTIQQNNNTTGSGKFTVTH